MIRTTQFHQLVTIVTVGKAEVGLILLGFSVLAFGFWLMPIEAFLSMQRLTPETLPIPEIALDTILSSPSILLAIGGLVQYVRGRRAFWKMNRGFSAQLLLSSGGIILLLLGAFFSWSTYEVSAYYAGKPTRPGKTLAEYLVKNVPYFVWFTLWIIAGTVLLVDSFSHKREGA
jgi:hypothetical protein